MSKPTDAERYEAMHGAYNYAAKHYGLGQCDGDCLAEAILSDPYVAWQEARITALECMLREAQALIGTQPALAFGVIQDPSRAISTVRDEMVEKIQAALEGTPS